MLDIGKGSYRELKEVVFDLEVFHFNIIFIMFHRSTDVRIAKIKRKEPYNYRLFFQESVHVPSYPIVPLNEGFETFNCCPYVTEPCVRGYLRRLYVIAGKYRTVAIL